MILNTSCYDIK